jgi:hypothetical protein
MVYLNSSTHNPSYIGEFVPCGMTLPDPTQDVVHQNRIDPIFVCRAAQHRANTPDCLNTPLKLQDAKVVTSLPLLEQEISNPKLCQGVNKYLRENGAML